MYTHLIDHLSVHKIITPFQCGFRPNHSTENVLLRTVEDWRFDVDRGKAVAAILIDFTKTPSLILCCSRNYTLLVLLTQHYVGSRIFFQTGGRVVIDGHSSNWLYVQQGVP